MRWHSHNRTGSVTDQNVVRDPYRNRFEGDWIDSVGPGKDTGLLFVAVGAISIALECCRIAILLDRRRRIGSRYLFYNWMLRSDNHVGCSI